MKKRIFSTGGRGFLSAKLSMAIFASASLLFLYFSAVLVTPPDAEAAETGSVTWGERIEVASGRAHRGPWRMNDSEWYFVDDATVAINEEGDAGVAWADHARLDIFFQVYGRDGRPRFSEPVNVSRNPDTFSWLPRVVMTSGEPGAVYMLWQEIIFSGGTHGGEVFFARSTDGGKSFRTPLNLSNTIAGAGKGRLSKDIWFNGSLDMARGSDGNLYAAWTVYEGGLFFSRSTDGGKHFSDPVRLAGGKGALPVRGPSLAVHDDIVRLAWTVGETQDADIHLAESKDAGRTFGDPQVLFETEGYSEAPKIAMDSTGTLHLVFAESPAGPLRQYDIRYTHSEPGKGGIADPRQISGRHSKKFQSVNFPYLALDDQGNVFVLWEIFPEGGIRPRGLGFTFSRTEKRTFAPPVVVPGTLDPEQGFNGSQQGLYMKKLAVNRSGEMAIVNSTFKPDASSRIWLIRGRVTGDRRPPEE